MTDVKFVYFRRCDVLTHNVNYSQICEFYKELLFLHRQTMIIEFGERALEDLYLTGSTDEKKYERLPKSIKQRYIKVVNILRSARRIEDLCFINSLHYERKSGDLKEMEAVWINDKYRLLFKSSPDEQGIIVNALLMEISKHYE